MQQNRKNPEESIFPDKEVTTDLRETVSIACKLSNVSFCPALGQPQKELGVGRREWQLVILLRLYLCKALFHMPTHLLLGSWQRPAAEGTYLPFVLLPPFHFSNPSCMKKPGKENKEKRKTCQVCRSSLGSAPNNKPLAKMVRFHSRKSHCNSQFWPLWTVQRLLLGIFQRKSVTCSWALWFHRGSYSQFNN